MWTRAGAEAYLNSIFGHKIRGPVDTEMRSHFARRGRSFVPADPMTSRLDFSSQLWQPRFWITRDAEYLDGPFVT